MTRDVPREFVDCCTQCRHCWQAVTEALMQRLQQITKCLLAIGGPYRAESARQIRRKIFQVAVMGKHPVTAPQFANEGVAILQSDMSLGSFADMRDDVF